MCSKITQKKGKFKENNESPTDQWKNGDGDELTCLGKNGMKDKTVGVWDDPGVTGVEMSKTGREGKILIVYQTQKHEQALRIFVQNCFF